MKIRADFKLRDLTTAELATLYDVPERTLRNWIKKHKEKIGEKESRWWNVNQVITIMKLRGPVTAIMQDEDEI